MVVSLVARPPVFVLLFALSIIQGSGRAAKKGGRHGNTYHMNDVRCTRGEHRGGGGHIQMHTKLYHQVIPSLGKTPDVHKIVSTLLDG